jgi:2-dehydro-3-deoxyphosphogluconate aldolase/(4S)-4-hydroxy-2-oxoglutarate aldolase
MGRSMVLEALFEACIVGVVREPEPSRAEQIAIGLLEGGLRAVEITANTPGCFEIVRALASRAKPPLTVIGAGTIKTEEELDRAKAAGASFIVSPHTDVRLIQRARSLGLIAIPGAMTPTEILTARAAGADVVKLFPIAPLGGARFVELMRGPLPEVPFWVSGGVGFDDIESYVEAGARLIGLTSALSGGLTGDVAAGARERAAKAVEALVDAKEGGWRLTVRGPAAVIELGWRDLSKLPESERASLSSVISGRHGEAARVRTLLSSAGIPSDARVKVRSQDGFERTVAAKSLYEGGFVQFASDGRRLERAQGGPLRLFIVGGAEQCDNVKALSQIEIV